MKFKLDFGAEIDLLTKDELAGALDSYGDRRLAEYALGLKHFDLPVLLGTVPASGDLTLGSTGDPDQTYCGPRQGFCWRVARVSVSGISSTQTVNLYKGDVGASRFVSVLSATSPAFLTSHGLLLKPGGHIVIDGSGLTVGEQITVSGEAIEAPAELIYKLIG